ncbi:hypothetical protein AAFF_G00083550 [Aldrovandia affinis]|uniref:Uncharacterized protein n=1 Tax=Aldrovandia affinis TaxID=143900 RepID=A0AAD7R1P3_9TELE|nr:hypothetical protein AAFF_G00083550 [Aldrovandia affinis]
MARVGDVWLHSCDTPQCAVPSPGTSLPSQERARARAQHRQQREAGRLRMRSSQEDSPPQTTRRGALALNRGKYGSVLLSPLAAFVNCSWGSELLITPLFCDPRCTHSTQSLLLELGQRPQQDPEP